MNLQIKGLRVDVFGSEEKGAKYTLGTTGTLSTGPEPEESKEPEKRKKKKKVLGGASGPSSGMQSGDGDGGT